MSDPTTPRETPSSIPKPFARRDWPPILVGAGMGVIGTVFGILAARTWAAQGATWEWVVMGLAVGLPIFGAGAWLHNRAAEDPPTRLSPRSPPMTEQSTTTATPQDQDDPAARLDGPIHLWFELSYANYLVTPRARLQSMPVEWQERMVACLDELDAAFDHLETPDYNVQTGEWVYVGECDAAQLAAAGVTSSERPSCEDNQAYYDQRGNELDRHQRVFVPGLVDPNPHYNRGRTYLPPFGEGSPR